MTDWLFPTVQPLAGDGARTKTRGGTSKGAIGWAWVWHTPLFSSCTSAGNWPRQRHSAASRQSHSHLYQPACFSAGP